MIFPGPVIPPTHTVYDALPVAARTTVRSPGAVLPASEMSPAVKPVTGSLNLTVKVIGDFLVGSCWRAD